MHDRRASSPMAGPDALDFWLGEWRCTWDGGEGRNRLTKELDDRVVVERFESVSPERWSGMSLSVHGDDAGWRQTWVDSTGNYWAFEGAALGGGFTFHTVDFERGRPIAKRMLFSDIRADSFEWRWERSEDGGDTWDSLWLIHYERASPSQGKESARTARNR